MMFARLDRDGSGRVTADELPDLHAADAVTAWDTDESGDLDPAEVARAMSHPPPRAPGSHDRHRGKKRRRDH